MNLDGLSRRGRKPKEHGESGVTTMERVKELRIQGLSNAEIAEQLGMTPGSVRTYCSTLIKNGELAPRPRGKVVKFRDGVTRIKERKSGTTIAEVKRLRNEGYNNQQIAEILGKPYGSVAQAAIRLIKSGEVTPLRTFGYEKGITPIHGNGPSEVRTIDQVRDLRLEGLNNREIAERLGISVGTVNVYASKLVSSGEIPSLRGRRIVKIERKAEPRRRIRRKRDETERAVAVSEDTELVKQYLEAHPRPTYKDGFRRIFEARERRRRPKGRRSETVAFDNQVKELLEQGLTRKRIGEQLGVPMTTIDSAVHRMIELGEYTPGRVTTHNSWHRHEAYHQIKERIKEMITQGLNVIQISDSLELPLQYVQMVTWRLGRRDEIKLIPEQLRPAGRTGYVDKKAWIPAGRLSDVYGAVAEMRNQG